MIKKIFVFVVILLLCLVPLGASIAFADSTINGVFSSSHYYSFSFTAINRIVNTDNYYTSADYSFGLQFDYDFANRRFYPDYYVNGIARNDVYIQSISSYTTTFIGNGFTDAVQGFITYDRPDVLFDVHDAQNPNSRVDKYIGYYFYYYNDTVSSDISFSEVNITVGDISIIPAVLQNQNPRIYYSDVNYFSFFGATYQGICYYRLYDYVTNNNNHLYFVVPVADSLSYSTTYYFVPPSSDYTTGYNAGYNEGYNVGITNNAIATYNNAYEIGYNAGFAVGRSTGYSEAIDSGASDNTFVGLISAVIDVPLNVLKGLFDFNVLGVNLLQFFYSIFTVLLLVFVIKSLLR